MLNKAGRGRVAVAAGLLCCLGIAAVSESASVTDQATRPVDSAALGAAVDAQALVGNGQQAAGSFGRLSAKGAAKVPVRPPAGNAPAGESPAAKIAAAKAAAAKAAAAKAAAAKVAAAKVAAAKAAAAKVAAAKVAAAKAAAAGRPVRPVAGLTQAQMNNAAIIVRTAQKMRMPKRAAVIAVATAIQESRLYNLASTAIPSSERYPHQGVGSDHDSVGLFQQRSSVGWGPVKDLMRPEFATAQFLRALRNVPGWQGMSLTYAAQAVQGSAFPLAYAKHEGVATAAVNALIR